MSLAAPARRGLRGGALLAAAGLTAAGSAVLLGPATGSASSHREAPLTAANPLVDNTDVYAFVSPDKPDTATLIANWTPFQVPAGGPNFYPWGAAGYRYNIKVDNNGDAKPDQTYRFTFTNIDARTSKTFLYNNGPVMSFDDPTLLFKQTYDLELVDAGGKATLLLDDQKVAPSHVGDASMPDYKKLRDEAVTPIGGGGGTVFVGQADDPFFIDIRIFDLLYGGDLSETGSDVLAGFNVNTIAMQVPIANLAKGGDNSGIVGAWSTTDQQTLDLATGKPSGEFVQVSRLSAPLVNEVVLPIGLKDAFNNLTPDKDATVMAAVDRVSDPEVPKLLEKIYKLKAPAAPRDDLVAAFLTGIKGLNQPPKVTPAEIVRLNTKIPPAKGPNRMGVLAKDNQGFPNGRRLFDDVLDIELQALAGAIRPARWSRLSRPATASTTTTCRSTSRSRTSPCRTPARRLRGRLRCGGMSSGASGTDSASAAPSDAPSPSAQASDEDSADIDSTNASDSDGVSTGALVGGTVLALLVGLGVGALLARRKSTSSTA
jgi:hypothetical protein